ncbi:hypothetical protein CASFOL_033188 [Castilleja foliolosa]|uniref:Uncharacterized protein n=1 Tax=Castilleja foliolosa TaxID=1961234 RepID=A0ABD3BZE8_9LAMI
MLIFHHRKRKGEQYDCFVTRRIYCTFSKQHILKSNQAFNMVKPYSDDDIDVVRRHWAECFLEDI